MAKISTILKQEADFLLGGVRWTFEEGWRTKQSWETAVVSFALFARSPFLFCLSLLLYLIACTDTALQSE